MTTISERLDDLRDIYNNLVSTRAHIAFENIAWIFAKVGRECQCLAEVCAPSVTCVRFSIFG